MAVKQTAKKETKQVKKDVNTIEPMIDLEALKREMMEQVRKEMEQEMRAKLMQEVKEEISIQEKQLEATKRVKDIDKNRVVPVMNITAHSLIYVSKRTGMEIEWSKYGDIEYIEMQELQTMRSSQRQFIDEPFVIILDNEVVSYLGLTKMYEKMIEPSEMDKIFNLNLEKFKEIVNTSPKGIQISIVNRAKQLIDKGELDSMTKINFINEKFNVDLRIV